MPHPAETPTPRQDLPPPGRTQSPYLTACEAAEYLRTTIQGVYALVKRGRLHALPGRRRLLFTQEMLDGLLKKPPRRSRKPRRASPPKAK
jgi:excisionase family DNA binding protein